MSSELGREIDQAIDQTQEPDGPSQREMVLIAADAAVLWRDRDFNAYATIPIGDHLEHHSLRSRAFKHWLIQQHAARFPTRINGRDRPRGIAAGLLQDVLCALEAEACSGAVHEPAVRVAAHGGSVFLDLGDEDWQAIKISVDGWQLVREAPIKFTRPSGMRPLPMPMHGGSVDQLRFLLSIAEGEAGDQAFALLLGWLVSALSPEGPYPVLVVSGEQGSGKSTLTTAVKRLIDPGLAERRAAPKDEHDLAIAARHGRVISLDNLSDIKAELADSLARLSTGSAIGTRALYSNDEEHVIALSVPIIVNGIPDLTARADLADRSVVIKLQAMAEEQRRSEREFWTEFDGEAPFILGALLDGVAHALAWRAEIEAMARTRPERPRMLDFAIWAEAAAPAFGFTRWQWWGCYTENRAEVAALSLEADPVAEVLLDELRSREPTYLELKSGAARAVRHFRGTMSGLLHCLNAHAPEGYVRARSWPSQATGLSIRLRRLAPALRRVGVGWHEERQTDRSRVRMITIWLEGR